MYIDEKNLSMLSPVVQDRSPNPDARADSKNSNTTINSNVSVHRQMYLRFKLARSSLVMSFTTSSKVNCSNTN